jgi:hypothetical protein
MHLLARSAVTAIVTLISLGANAADLDYPRPLVGQPQYGIASPPAAPPPQVVIVPGPTVAPQYPGAAYPPPARPYPYGPLPPITPRADVVPPVNCPPTWRCGERGCDWEPGCAPPPQHYSGHDELPRPGYLRPEPPGPQVYAAPNALPAPEPYPGPYAPEVYPGQPVPNSR